MIFNRNYIYSSIDPIRLRQTRQSSIGILIGIFRRTRHQFDRNSDRNIPSDSKYSDSEFKLMFGSLDSESEFQKSENSLRLRQLQSPIEIPSDPFGVRQNSDGVRRTPIRLRWNLELRQNSSQV